MFTSTTPRTSAPIVAQGTAYDLYRMVVMNGSLSELKELFFGLGIIAIEVMSVSQRIIFNGNVSIVKVEVEGERIKNVEVDEDFLILK